MSRRASDATGSRTIISGASSRSREPTLDKPPPPDALQPTEIAARFDADAFFPAVDPQRFAEVSRERHHSPAERGHDWHYDFVRYERRR